MNSIIVSAFGAFTALLLVFAISEILAKVTKGWVPSVLVIMILMLVGFSTGLFPKTIIDDAGVSDALFKVACGLLVTHLGTLISRKEMAAQWKTVIISLGRAMSVQRYTSAASVIRLTTESILSPARSPKIANISSL